MRIFAFILIFLFSLNLSAQKEDYSLFPKNKIYYLSNSEFNMNLRVSKVNKKLQLETDVCIDCYDIKQPFYIIKSIKELKTDFYFFSIKDYYFVVDLSTKSPVITIVNAAANDIKNPILN